MIEFILNATYSFVVMFIAFFIYNIVIKHLSASNSF
jgi:hypothetical protein